MCFFVGNDFIPHMPLLSIRSGGIDALLFIYKNLLSQMNGYLTNDGELNVKNLDEFLKQVGLVEPKMVKREADFKKMN